jgi:hypothetical protein
LDLIFTNPFNLRSGCSHLPENFFQKLKTVSSPLPVGFPNSNFN